MIGGQLGRGPHGAIEFGATDLRTLERLEYGQHAVVVDLRERLELVVVAASAPQVMPRNAVAAVPRTSSS